MAYDLEGALLEVCTCNILCPCWVGEDPDNGTCQSIMAWHFDKGTIDGVDVSGLTFAGVMDIPGNVLAGNWRAMVYIDDKSTPEQEEALLNLYTGKLGGPVADLVKLIGEVVGVERVPIIFDLDGVSGSVKIGDAAEAELVAFKGATGKESALYDTIFTTVPGAPAYVGKALTYRANVPALNIDIDLKDHNAVSGPFRFQS
ncbi:MAG: DUF1326 domain-containing protein [Chloroflexi bacterium]|nr:DUF1326 domain-containing protein [Chloroflexota bacterium]